MGEIGYLIGIVAVALVAVLVVFLLWRRKSMRYDSRLARIMRTASVAWIKELYVPDGMDGQIHVPNILRTAAGFVVVDVIRVHGAVFGADSIDEWTVLVDGRSRKFRNPIVTNRSRVLAVRTLVPGVPVHGLVVLLGDVQFPKGQPGSVTTLDTLAAELQGLPVIAPGVGNWDEAWYGLAACANARQDAV